MWRRVELFKANEIQLPKGWPPVERFAKIRRWGLRNTKPFDETSIYMLSKPIDCAYTVGQIVQQHWTVENNLHWVKDVNFGEDNMSWITPRNAAMIAMLNNVAMNLLRRSGQKPTKDNLAMLCNNIPRLARILNRT